MKTYFLKSRKLGLQGLLHIQMPKAHSELWFSICMPYIFKNILWVNLFLTAITDLHLPVFQGVRQGASQLPDIYSTTRTHFRTCTGFPGSYYLSVLGVSYSLRLLWFLTLYFDSQPLCSVAGFLGWPCIKPSGPGYELYVQILSF